MALPVPAALALLLLFTAGCARKPDPTSDAQVEAVAREVVPLIERAVGLTFRSPPALAVRTREQVRRYLENKLDSEFPPEEIEGVTAAYRLFGLLPDTLDLRALLLALYTEQVAGFYDPDSSTLYVVAGADPAQVRLVLAHELVHALQGQYVHLDSLLSQRGDNDRRVAAQAVMEGQATLASVAAIVPDRDADELPNFWRDYRETIRREQERMPIFSSAPPLIRETLVFPYFAGADFVRWFRRAYQDTVPFGPRLPASTEHILHPDRYREGDAPVPLAIRGAPDAIYEDNLGEFEVRILLTMLTGSESTGSAAALRWAGDRYVVLPAGGEHALVWWSVWDTPQAAERFRAVFEPGWRSGRSRPGRRFAVEAVRVADQAGVRLVDAPVEWDGWRSLPRVERR